ncbi:MAG: ABC transporter permease [Bacteroidota bacterium]
MKELRVFINKEFKHIFRDFRTLLILFGLPIAQVFLFGYAITNEVKDAHITIWDQANDAMSKKLSAKLLSTNYFKLSDVSENYDDITNGFKSGEHQIAIVIPPKFGQKFNSNNAKIQVISDASDPNQANILANYATGIISSFMLEELDYNPPNQITTEVRMTYNPELKGVYLFVPGVITVILMIISTLLTSIALTREKELGTMEVLLVSPLKPGIIVIGKVIPYLLLSFMNAMIILVVGFTVFEMPLVGSFGLLVFEMILFVVAALSIGIFVSTKTDSQQVAMLISLFALMLPTILLSGFIFPIDSMPWPLQVLSNIMPAKFFIIIVKGIMLKGVGLEVLWKETLIVIGFIILFTGASIKSFKIRLA